MDPSQADIIKEALRERGLPTDGTSEELQNRLLANLIDVGSPSSEDDFDIPSDGEEFANISPDDEEEADDKETAFTEGGNDPTYAPFFEEKDSTKRVHSKVLVDNTVIDEGVAFIKYFQGAIKYPFTGIWKRSDGTSTDVLVTGVDGWDCGILLKGRVGKTDATVSVPAFEIICQTGIPRLVLMDHRNYGRLAVMVNKSKFSQLFEDWKTSLDWERKYGHYGTDSDDTEKEKKLQTEPDNVESFKPIVLRWIATYSKTRDWQPEQDFFKTTLSMVDSKKRLECLLENIPVLADEAHVLHAYLSSVFVECEGTWEDKKVIVTKISPNYKRRGIFFEGHDINDTEMNKTFKIPAHLTELTPNSVSTSSMSASSVQDLDKALSDYKLWRSSATIVTEALLRQTLQDVLGITAAWSRHPIMNLNLDLSFLDNPEEEEVEQEETSGNDDGDVRQSTVANDDADDEEEDENFGDVDYMSNEPPITINVPPVQSQRYKRKEPDAVSNQKPPPKKSRQQ